MAYAARPPGSEELATTNLQSSASGTAPTAVPRTRPWRPRRSRERPSSPQPRADPGRWPKRRSLVKRPKCSSRLTSAASIPGSTSETGWKPDGLPVFVNARGTAPSSPGRRARNARRGQTQEAHRPHPREQINPAPATVKVHDTNPSWKRTKRPAVSRRPRTLNHTRTVPRAMHLHANATGLARLRSSQIHSRRGLPAVRDQVQRISAGRTRPNPDRDEPGTAHRLSDPSASPRRTWETVSSRKRKPPTLTAGLHSGYSEPTKFLNEGSPPENGALRARNSHNRPDHHRVRYYAWEYPKPLRQTGRTASTNPRLGRPRRPTRSQKSEPEGFQQSGAFYAARPRNRFVKYTRPLPVTFVVLVTRVLPFGSLIVRVFTSNNPISNARCVG